MPLCLSGPPGIPQARAAAPLAPGKRAPFCGAATQANGRKGMAEHEVFEKLRKGMREKGFDALVALSPDNVAYTAGFMVPSHLSNRFRRTVTILAGDSYAAQIVVNVEENLARQESRFPAIYAYNQFTEEPGDLMADMFAEAGVAEGRIAIELEYMPAKDYIRLSERLPKARFEECRDIYFAARMEKTPEEIALLRKVGQLTDRVIGEAIGAIRPGMREKELARFMVDRMMEDGVDDLRMNVGSGVRSAIANCKPTDKEMARGDVIRVEILGNLCNYKSNVTRTAVLGSPTREQERIWASLIRIRGKCHEALKPGTRVPDLYRTFVEASRTEGLDPAIKFLGHGIGQTAHEEPYITETREVTLAPNMTLTMEPIFLFPGRMGFHVEDMYLVTPEGHERITGPLTPNDELIRIEP